MKFVFALKIGADKFVETLPVGGLDRFRIKSRCPALPALWQTGLEVVQAVQEYARVMDFAHGILIIVHAVKIAIGEAR